MDVRAGVEDLMAYVPLPPPLRSQASEQSAPILRRMGFESVGELTLLLPSV